MSRATVFMTGPPLRVIGLTIILFVCYAVAGRVAGLQGDQTPQQAAQAASALLVVCFLNTVVLSRIILRSRWSGWRLMAAIFVVFYGVMTVMGQIESAVFISRLPPGVLPRLFLMGALVAAPFSALAVLILGKAKTSVSHQTQNVRLAFPASEWAWKLAVIAVAYVTLYFTFGYFVAWRVPAVREYYGGIDEGGFLGQLGRVLRDTPWLVPLQVVRAWMWTALALPVIGMLEGTWLETALTLGVLFAVVMNAQLLLPNPYMSDAVRMAHLAETASSNFLFGVLVGWLLARPTATRSLPAAK